MLILEGTTVLQAVQCQTISDIFVTAYLIKLASFRPSQPFHYKTIRVIEKWTHH